MNEITDILHQLKEGRLSMEEAAERIRSATAPAAAHTDIDYDRLARELMERIWALKPEE